MKKKTMLRDLILPNKKINFFIITVMLLGILSGSIFLMMLSDSDKSSVVLQIQTFFQNIHQGNIDNGLALKNSLVINYLFIGIIWVLGFSMIGIFINIFLTYIKGFLVGFSISSIFLTFGYKGIPASLLYSLLSQILNIIIVVVLSIYSIMFSYHLVKIITSKKGNNKLMLRKYFTIFMISIMISFVSSLLEVYLFPNVLKIMIHLYI